jgi:DNA-directed RNA polymerases I, II, and III subunit RPABC5
MFSNIYITMIIPVKCFTCGKVLANKYQFYLREVRKKKIADKMNVDNVIYLTKENVEKTPEGDILDKLQLDKMCCRRHILTHVDIE